MTLPSGTVTFLFTDIEGSTKLWEQHPEAMKLALAKHDALLKNIFQSHNGHIFKTVGDAFYVAFDSSIHAIEAAIFLDDFEKRTRSLLIYPKDIWREWQ